MLSGGDVIKAAFLQDERGSLSQASRTRRACRTERSEARCFLNAYCVLGTVLPGKAAQRGWPN